MQRQAGSAARWLGLALLAGLVACGDAGPSAGEDAGVPDAAWPPDRASLAPPESYDCNAAATPPDRTSSVPLGCYADPGCEELVVVAHRGLSYLAPQNTLSAVRAAIVLGVDMVEVDVRLSAEGVPVVIHDGDVNATTDGTGDVDTMTVVELQALDLVVAGDLVGDFSCERIPTFREVLQLARGRIDVMVDLKEGAPEAAVIIDEEQMVPQAVMLGNQTELTAARGMVPDLRLMIRPEEAVEVQPLWDAFVPVPTVVHIDPGFDDPETIDLVHGLGAKLLIDVWTQDANAILLGDLSGYVEVYEKGIDIQQSEWAFLPLWAVGRGDPP